MANAGITFDFAAESAKLRSEIDKVRKEVSSISKVAKGAEQAFKLVGGAIVGAFSIGAITGWLRTVNQAADTLNDLSTRLGASASGLQSLQIAAQQAGGSAEAMAQGLSKLQVSLGDALQGGKTTTVALQQLGLSARELAALPTDEAMVKVAEALSDVENASLRAKIGNDLLGRGYKENAGFYADAGAALAEVNRQLDEQGAKIDNLDVAKIGVMNDDLALQGQIVQNLGIKFVAGLSPAIGAAVDSVGGMVSNLGGASEAGEKFGVIMVAAVKAAEAGAYALGSAFETVRFVIAGALDLILSGVSNVFGALSTGAEFVGLDSLSAGLRTAADGAATFALSFADISATAKENAIQAASYAIEAGAQMLNAPEIFAAKLAEFNARAAEQAKNRNNIVGDVTPLGGDPSTFAPGKLTVSKESLGKIDPATDPEVLRQISLNDTMRAVADAHNATMLGKIEAFEQTKLGMMLTNADLMQQIEFNKNATLGDAMSSLVGMAIQQGGALGKAGKALAIAQTVWSTGQAIMKAMAEVPWPANIAAAANIAAMGVAQLANIKRTNIGGAGSITAGRGGGASAAASPALSDNVGPQGQPLEQQTAVQIIVQGSLFAAQETVDWLAEKLGEAVSSRDMVFISNTSRQAMELRG